MEEIYVLLDKIMKKNHEIAGYYISMAENEIKHGREGKLLEKLAETRMQEIKELYLKLEELMKQIEIEGTQKYYEQLNISVTTKEITKPEANIVVNVREDVLGYIKEAYETMNFLSDAENDIFSIYDGTPSELIRDIEYETYKNNIASIENRADVDDYEKLEDFGYVQIAQVIEDLSDNVTYDKSAKRIDKVIKKLESGEYKIDDKSEMYRLRTKLIHMKYGELYKGANQRSNGLIASSVYRDIIEKSKEYGMLSMSFGLTEEEYKKLYESRIYEGLNNTKEEVRYIFNEEKEKRPKKKNTIKEVRNNVSKFIQDKVPEISSKIQRISKGAGR